MSNLTSTSKLTEFPPLEAEEKADGRFSLSKFMFWRKSDVEPATISTFQASYPTSSSGPSSVPPLPTTTEVIPEVTGAGRRADSLENVTVSASIPVRRKLATNTPVYYRSDSNLSNPSPDPMDGVASPFAFEARTLPNVLRRISNLIAMGSHNQADMKKYWMPDSVSKECYECGERFTTFRRKHHCRICGQIFCSRCCSQEIPGKIIGYSGDLRVCIYCCKIVLSYLQSADLNSDLTDDLRMVQEDLQNRFGAATPDSSLGQQGSGQFGFSSGTEYAYRSLPRRKASVGYQEERFATSKNLDTTLESVVGAAVDEKGKPLSDWVGLKSLWDEMCHPVSGIDWATHRHNMIKNYHSCVVGSELVDWLLAQRKITWRGQGIQIGQMLIDSGLLECVSQAEQVFMDAYALYRPATLPLPSLHEVPEPTSARSSTDHGDGRKWSDTVQDPLWMKQIQNPQRKANTDDSASIESKDVASDSDEKSSKNRLPSSSSMYSVDLNLKNSSVSMSRPKDSLDPYDNPSVSNPGGLSPSVSTRTTPRPQRKSTTMSITTEAMTDEFLQKTLLAQKERSKDVSVPTGWHSPQELTNDSEMAAFQRLCNAYIKHENDFLIQLLESMNLSSSWIDIILPIVHKVTEIVRPDVKHSDDDMDIRQYIQFKKVPGGAKEDCRIVNGAVCTKNIAHRNMRHKLKDPKILLVGSSIDYQRFENRFLSLEPLVMQEFDYLRNTVARICALNPDLVIVEKTVARLAQEFLLDHGITLVINVKPSVMERIARCTQGVVCDSVDTHIGGRPQLGLCHNFYLETFKISEGMQKTLMFFDGCAMHLGCTVLLRGGTTAELMKVKKIISLMMFVAYNWRLERSFHIDSFSMPPSGVDESSLSSSINSPSSEDFVEAREELSPEAISPLRNELSKSPSDDSGVITENKNASVTPNSITDSKRSFRCLKDCLSQIILSASPFITFPLPYLETEEGKRCDLRTFFPMEVYSSLRMNSDKRLSSSSMNPELIAECENNIINAYMHGVYINSKIFMDYPVIERRDSHSFTSKKLTSPIGSDDVQSLIADFRRVGGRLLFTSQAENQLSQAQKLRSNNSSWNTLEPDKLRSGEVSGRVDCLDPFLHQKLSVSFCSYSPLSTNFPYFCVNPWTVNMDMYGRNDISLGMFLERYCFRKSYLCPAKNCDTPMLQHVRRFVHQDACIQVILKELESPILGSGDNILMWSWCTSCKTVSPIVPMSVDAWFLSFAKYLELRFHGIQYTRRAFDSQCMHSLHHEHQQFFAQHNIVAAFKYSKVKLWEVSLPPFFIRTKHVPKSVQQLIEDVKSVAIIGHGVHGNIMEVLNSLKESAAGLRVEDVLNGLFELLKVEKSVFRSKIEDIQVSLTSPNLQGDKFSNKESDAFLWKVTDAIGFLKCNIAEMIQSWNTKLNDFLQLRKKEEKQAKGGITKNDTEQSMETKHLSRNESEPLFATKELEDSIRSTGNLIDSDYLPDPKKDRDADTLSIGTTSTSGLTDESAGTFISDELKSRTDRANSPSRGLQSSEKSDSDVHRVPDSLNVSDETTDSGKLVPEKRTSSTVKTLISNLISGTGMVQLVQSPWPNTEHSFSSVLSSLPVTIFEAEPSSVVAFTLSSTEYRKEIKEKRKMRLGSSSTNQDELISSTGSPKDVFVDKNDFTSKEMTDEKSTSVDEKDGSKDADNHIEVQFRSSNAKFYCRVYFADHFRQLRELCLVEGEEFFIRSISRCVSWAASGGKSGSTFCKTVDDRFIVKQMSRFEIQSFLDFAPHYFDYMTTAFQEKRPTVLAKIVGVFRIGFKNSHTTSASKMDILIMENLFYGRTISQKFDLKGSIRNRLATATGKEQEDLVLLDENLLNMACEYPLYIRPHTKTVLLTALTNDSRFLGTQMVMDYSLLVGFDEEKRELVVGVIDYIRTFTWDKKIETFVKSSGILGGQGKTPTVVSPDEYQTRFCEAMDRYFLLVPDRWMGLGLGVDT
ncbi:1-phosphatidylinositol 3-phosphate 5-kinase [Orchesella cincta]|uniref:1-phosphatidylinositol-3-phosphate 5-kinase n=1 Tax=Orchesella cincta TaxID=48709 RepID=A0A1D2MU22_ORCCI|nr:1-phosphatidylinositol 3-phosphate 5-kinase [Orchesella cincta]